MSIPTIRDFQASDIPEIVRVQHAAVPLHPWSVGELERDLQKLEERLKYHWCIAESNCEPVGFSRFARNAGSYHPQKFGLDLCVHPAFQARGIGNALYLATLERLQAFAPIGLRTQVRESDARGLRFAQDRGFLETKRDFESTLELALFDFAAFERPLLEGIELKNFRDLDSPVFRRQFHQVFSTVRLDVPRAEPPTLLTFEFFEENVLDDPEVIPEAFVFATRGEQIVGFTGGYQGAQPGWVDQWLTAVIREARGQGLATAIKVHSLRAVLELGFKTVRTDNDTQNSAMLAVNDKLGYQRQPAVLSMLKSF
jgi:mycothiol synthase